MADVPGWREAREEAERALAEGGAPFGAALVRTVDGVVLASGHNRHYQDGDVTAHAEIVTLRNAGLLRPTEFAATTMVTNAIPCFLCAGAIVQLGIPRVVAGLAEWEGQRTPSHRFLLDQGVEVVDLQKVEVLDLMLRFVAAHPDDWQDDLGAAIAGMDVSAIAPPDRS